MGKKQIKILELKDTISKTKVKKKIKKLIKNNYF